MLKEVIILNGYPRSGKTTFANLLNEIRPTIVYSSIDYVKRVAEDYYNWNGNKTEDSRKFLSDTKHFLIENTNLIEQDLISKKQEFNNSNKEILVIDIREVSEIKKYKKKFNAVTVLVTNDNIDTTSNNKSDSQVNDINYDYTIQNNGTITDLKKSAEKFISTLYNKNKKD